MTDATRGALRGALVVARRDLGVNLRSVRFVVLSLLVLLVMLAAAFGLSGFAPTGPGTENEWVLWAFAAYPTGNVNATVAVVRATDYAGVAHGNAVIELGYPYPLGQANASFQLKATNTTDALGWARISGLSPGNWPVRMALGASYLYSAVFVPPSLPSESYTVLLRPFDVIGDRAGRDNSIEALTRAGTPAAGAAVFLNGTAHRALDGQGFWTERLDPGTYNLTVVYGGESQRFTAYVRPPAVTSPLGLGPDYVLYFVAFALMGLFAPIVAIALSYDAITKERQYGAMEVLLAKPASRTGLAVGKFLGTFASVGLPVLGVVLGALAGVALITGKWPDLTFDVAFVLGTLALIATYVLLMQIFSTLAKSPGTAILSAILVWFVFNLLWNLIFVLVEAALGIQGGTESAFALSAATLLFNPTGVYQLTLAASFPPTLAASAGTYNLPDWSGPAAFAVWIGVLLVLAVVAFRKRAL